MSVKDIKKSDKWLSLNLKNQRWPWNPCDSITSNDSWYTTKSSVTSTYKKVGKTIVYKAK